METEWVKTVVASEIEGGVVGVRTGAFTCPKL